MPTLIDRDPRRARLTVALVFAANGAVFGSWAPRIAEVKAELELSTGILGLVLLAPGLASLVSMPLAGAASTRFGSAAVTRAAAVVFLLLPGLIGLAGSGAQLAGALLLWGFAMGALDVAMNAQGVTVERSYGRSVLSGFHAIFSLGALTGAGVGSVCAALGVDLAVQLAALGALLLLGLAPLSRALLPDPPGAHDAPAPLFARPTGPLVALAVAAFAVLLCEGAVADWSAVHLREDLAAGPAVAGLGFVAFSGTMTAGRLAGDRILTRFGRLTTVRAGCTVAAAGTGLGLAAAALAGPGPLAVTATVAGFAVLGAGISATFPALLAEAGHGTAHPGAALAAVSTGGYTGFLVGPTAIGGVAEVAGLPAALWLLPVLAATAALLVRRSSRVRPYRSAVPARPVGARECPPDA